MILLLKVLVIVALAFASVPRPVEAVLVFVNPDDPGTTPGHPVRKWEDSEKAVVAAAVKEWEKHVNNVDGLLGRWTLRWEGASLFTDLRVPGGGGDNLTDAGGVTVRPGDWQRLGFPAPPRGSADFPEGEIYFNARLRMFIDPTPSVDEPNEVPNDRFDFLTIVTHELGHALGIMGHLPAGSVAVMDPEVRSGNKGRRRIDPLDIAFIRLQGGPLAAALIVPEPSTWVLLFSSFAVCVCGLRRRHLHLLRASFHTLNRTGRRRGRA